MRRNVENAMSGLSMRSREVGRTMEANMNVQMRVEDKLYRSKRIMLFGEINGGSVDSVIKQILALPPNTREVELWIKSEGGSVEDGFGLLDVIRSRPYIVKTIGVGFVSSMAVPILSSGTKGHRYIGDNTSIMVHEIVWGSQGSHTEMKIKGDQTRYLQNKYVEILQSTTTQTKEFWAEFISSHEKWITPKKAIKLGLADKIALL